jgi:hypothetical protein
LLAALSCSDDRVVISEFMASNDATIADGDGDFVDWLELHNQGATSVDLDGWFLTDDMAILRRYRLPEVRLVAGGEASPLSQPTPGRRNDATSSSTR